MIRPYCIRTIRADSRSTISIWRGSLPQRSAWRCASSDGCDLAQIDQLPLGLGDDLVRHDEEIAILQRLARSRDSIQDDRGEIVAGSHLRHPVQADNRDSRRHGPSGYGRSVVRSP
jgi:hypothetical protein